MKATYLKYLKSKEWMDIRELVLERDNHRCKMCGCEVSLQIHHTTYENIYNEKNNLNDLITLCSKCHSSVHINNYTNIDEYKSLKSYVDKDGVFKYLNNITQDKHILSLLSNILDINNDYSCILMLDTFNSVSTWEEFYNAIGVSCNDKDSQQKIKRFLTKHKLMMTTKTINMNGLNDIKFVMNPFIFGSRTSSSQLAIMLFKGLGLPTYNK